MHGDVLISSFWHSYGYSYETFPIHFTTRFTEMYAYFLRTVMIFPPCLCKSNSLHRRARLFLNYFTERLCLYILTKDDVFFHSCFPLARIPEFSCSNSSMSAVRGAPFCWYTDLHQTPPSWRHWWLCRPSWDSLCNRLFLEFMMAVAEWANPCAFNGSHQKNSQSCALPAFLATSDLASSSLDVSTTENPVPNLFDN